MKVIKLLERKEIIRSFGFLLVAAPFFNSLVSLFFFNRDPSRSSFYTFGRLLVSGTGFDNFLWIASVVIGLTMLSGSAKTWKFVLILLAGHIYHQLMNLGPNLRTSWIYGLFFFVNLGLFIFIADQLVWKVKTPPIENLKKPFVQFLNAPIKVSEKRIIIHFKDLGPWARLISITSKGLHLRSLTEPPQNISRRPIEIALSHSLVLKTKYTRQLDRDFFFEFYEISHEQVSALNRWILEKAC